MIDDNDRVTRELSEILENQVAMELMEDLESLEWRVLLVNKEKWV